MQSWMGPRVEKAMGKGMESDRDQRGEGWSGHGSEGLMVTGSGELEAWLSQLGWHHCQSGDGVMDAWRMQQQGMTEAAWQGRTIGVQ
jgi:hypothetical protein